MPDSKPTLSPVAMARLAGLLYLAIIVLGIGSEIILRPQFVVADDPHATARRIVDAQSVVRLSFAADSVMALCDAGLAVLLFVLLRPVGHAVALVAMVMRLVQASLIGMNLLNQHMALMVLTGPGYRSAMESGQLDVLAHQYVVAHAHGYDLGLIFFGICSLATGYLVYRSKFLPRWIGIMVAAAGLVYLAGSYLRFLAPVYFDMFEFLYVIPLVAELGFCLWLLLFGVDARRWREAEAAARSGHASPS